MNSKTREIRRKLFANKESLEVTDHFDEDLIEDIRVAAPKLRSLLVTILEGNTFSSQGISTLENLEDLQILEGANLEQLLLPDLQDLKHLKSLYINIDENTQLEEIDLSSLAGNESIEKLNIECNVNSLKLDGLSSCINLRRISLSRVNGTPIDLSALSGCPKLDSIQILYFGRDSSNDIGVFKIILPQDIPLSLLALGGFLEEGEPDIDFSILKDQKRVDMISLCNIGLTSFDLGLLSNAERIGQIYLDENDISEIDITPIIEKQMNAYLGIAFSVDEDTKVIVRVSHEKVDELIAQPERKVTEQTEYGPVENLYSFEWLRYSLETYNIDWR